MSAKAIVLTVLIVMIKKDCRLFFADSLLLFGFYSENFHFIVIPRTYAVNI